MTSCGNEAYRIQFIRLIPRGCVGVFSIILEGLLLASSCSIDAFCASFAYGSNKVKIPFLSNQIINLISVSMLGLSLFAGSVIRRFLPVRVSAAICFVVLFVLGLVKLLDGVTKSVIRRHGKKNKESINKEFKFSLLNFNFILSLYANPEEADINADKVISPSEAVFLAVSLSLDGLAVGFGAALGNVNILAVMAASLAANIAAVYFGCRLGNRLAHKLPFNLSWLGGAVLCAAAFFKLLR